MPMSGVRGVLLILLCVWPGEAIGGEVGVNVLAGAPPISIAQAVERAQAYARDRGFDLEGQFVHMARLEYDDGGRLHTDGKRRRGQYWDLHWRWAMPRMGGEVSARVYMDGEILLERHGP